MCKGQLGSGRQFPLSGPRTLPPGGAPPQAGRGHVAWKEVPFLVKLPQEATDH